MNNLILFTNRSGSTVLTDLISYSQGTINLGEGLHSLARQYNYNNDTQRQSELYKQFSSTSITARYHNEITNGFDHIGFFKAKSKRIEILKQSNESWTAKEQLEKQTMDFSFIQYCIDNGVNVYMTHRKNIVEQFISKINARYRIQQDVNYNKFPNLRPNVRSSSFIFTNEDNCMKYDTIYVPFHWLHMYTMIFISQLFVWRVIYDRFKNDIKLVSYEDNIKPLQLEKFGITQQHIQQYQKEKVHLVPTPHNTNKVVITDDLPAPILGAWQQALYYVDRHRYLVEV
jgi:hypothetical protein